MYIYNRKKKSAYICGSGNPAYEILFCLGRNDEIRKEYLRISY